MELYFLHLGEYNHKEMNLAHIKRMVNIKLDVGDTYMNLFEKLENHFKTDDAIKAAKDWIEFNKSEQEDLTVFQQILCNESGTFASFDLR